MKYCLVATLALLSLAGCAAQLTEQGRMVREIQPDWSTKCEHLGAIEASEGNGFDIPDDRRGAFNRIRNQVAELGGDAFVINQSSSNELRTLIQADAYKCQ